MPSGQVDKPMIEDNRDGTVSIKYDPREEGIHEMAVKYNGEHVQGSPVSVPKLSFLISYPPFNHSTLPRSTNSTSTRFPLDT